MLSRRLGQEDLYKFQGNLDYISEFKAALNCTVRPVSKNKNKTHKRSIFSLKLRAAQILKLLLGGNYF